MMAPDIDRDALIEDLRALVRIPSITGGEEAVSARSPSPERPISVSGRAALARARRYSPTDFSAPRMSPGDA